MPPSSTTSEPAPLLGAVRQTILGHDMLAAGERILVGVSGGVDSMVLLHLLHALADETGIRLGVAHLNHGLRGAAAARDAALVERTAKAMGIRCHMGAADVYRVKRGLGLSLEAAGRRVRHAYFRKVMTAGGYRKLALGHHRDDSVEQVLIALLRGSGMRGLSGIAPVRAHIIRPLIGQPRDAIAAYARENRIPFTNDASNRDRRFVRNRVRHELLPHLAATYNPRIRHHLDRLATLLRDEDAWIESQVDAPFAAAVTERRKDAIVLRVAALRQAHPALARRLIRRAIQSLVGGLQRITFTHVDAVRRLCEAHDGEKMLHLPGRIRVGRENSRLTIERLPGSGRIRQPAKTPAASVETIIDAPFPPRISIPSLGIGLRFSHCRPAEVPAWRAIDRCQAFFDLDRLAPPLILRRVRPGDRFQPLGAPGTQKLKKFFSDHRVDRLKRASAVVLADQRRIVWLLDQRTDETARLSPETTRVLGVEFFLLDT